MENKEVYVLLLLKTMNVYQPEHEFLGVFSSVSTVNEFMFKLLGRYVDFENPIFDSAVDLVYIEDTQLYQVIKTTVR